MNLRHQALILEKDLEGVRAVDDGRLDRLFWATPAQSGRKNDHGKACLIQISTTMRGKLSVIRPWMRVTP